MFHNRIEDLLPADDSESIRKFREPSSIKDLKEYASLVKQWALQRPVPCLVAAFALGVAVACLIKRK